MQLAVRDAGKTRGEEETHDEKARGDERVNSLMRIAPAVAGSRILYYSRQESHIMRRGSTVLLCYL